MEVMMDTFDATKVMQCALEMVEDATMASKLMAAPSSDEGNRGW